MNRVREEQATDKRAVYHVNHEAFGRHGEAKLVDALRAAGAVTLSLVAEAEGEVVGHILFSPVELSSPEGSTPAVGLGPMAVLPEHQGEGIGSRLVREGLDHLRREGHELVFVLGHPTYYPRFGFQSTRPHSIDSEFDVPAEVFMVAELRPGALHGRTGTVVFRPEFHQVTE